MADKTAAETNIEIAQRVQEKFDAYSIGLIFTILGLSIQTAKFGPSPVADSLEILGWLLLLVSGLTGLSRLECIPQQYKLHSEKVARDATVSSLQVARLQSPQQRDIALVPSGSGCQ